MSSTVINFRNQINQNRIKTSNKSERETIASLVENRENNLKIILKSKVSPKMDNHFISHLSDEMRVIPTIANNGEGGEAFKLSP